METLAALRRQGRSCELLGSSMYGELLRLVADDYELGGQTRALLSGRPADEDPWRSALGLRLLGGLHRLVLSGMAPELAVFYPSVGGEWDPVIGWDAFQQVLDSHRAEIRVWLDQPPQTNEVGRAAALMGGLLRIGEVSRLPVRLFEIGASAGLNLRADRFCYGDDRGRFSGPADSPVRMAGAWQGASLEPWPELVITERVGCDIAPLDPATDDGALTVTSYVWPDQAERLARLRGALEVARQVPAEVRRQDAASFLHDLELARGSTTVLWHSVMWQYLTRVEQAAVRQEVLALGKHATEDRPFAYLSMEPDRTDFPVVLEHWPAGRRRVLGTAAPHGLPAHWEIIGP